jgi:hypothetical protein
MLKSTRNDTKTDFYGVWKRGDGTYVFKIHPVFFASSRDEKLSIHLTKGGYVTPRDAAVAYDSYCLYFNQLLVAIDYAPKQFRLNNLSNDISDETKLGMLQFLKNHYTKSSQVGTVSRLTELMARLIKAASYDVAASNINTTAMPNVNAAGAMPLVSSAEEEALDLSEQEIQWLLSPPEDPASLIDLLPLPPADFLPGSTLQNTSKTKTKENSSSSAQDDLNEFFGLPVDELLHDDPPDELAPAPSSSSKDPKNPRAGA